MLTGQRYKSYSDSANLGLIDVASIKNSDIINTVTNELKTASESMKDTASSLIQGVLPFDSKEAANVLDSGIRKVRDTFSTLASVTGISQSDIEAEIASTLPGGLSVQKEFMSLSAACRANGTARMPGFKPFGDKLGCGQNNGTCSTGEVNGLLSRITGGAIGAIGSAIQSILRSLTALANIGYSAGLCKIFSALVSSLGASPGIVQRGAAGILASVGLAGNMTAVMDVAANMNRAIPSAEIPGLVSMISGNFSVPGNFANGKLDQLYTASMLSFDAIQPGFDKSSSGDIYSLANLSNNDAFGGTAKSYLGMANLSDIDTPVYADGNELAVAYVGDQISDPFSDIGEYFV